MHTPVEKLLEFVFYEAVTGLAICEKLVVCLTWLGLDPKLCRAQTYDGAGNMAGKTNGCAVHFQAINSRAHYYHCASHSLNLALCKVSKLLQIQTIMEDMKAVALFKFSPKRNQCLLKALGAAVNEDGKRELRQATDCFRKGEAALLN